MGDENTPGVDDADSAWTDGFDEDTLGYIQNKGWENPGDMLTSYRNLEKLSGGSKRVVEIPDDDTDEEAMGRFYNRLGRPDAPENYGFEAPEEADEKLFEWFRQTSHDGGLTNKQAAFLFENWQKMTNERMEEMKRDIDEQGKQALVELKKEWGQDYDKKIQDGRNAAQILGYDQERLSLIEEKLGTSEMMRLFVTLGSRMSESSFADGSRSGSGFGNSAAEAKAELENLKNDQVFMARYIEGDRSAVDKYSSLLDRIFK